MASGFGRSKGKNPAAVGGSSFRAMTNEAKVKYGEADVRPQDTDPGMLRFIRRTNLEMISPFPENYHENLLAWINNLESFPTISLNPFSMDMVTLQDSNNQDMAVIRKIKPESGQFAVLSVDFEFHQEVSYDGFICVASVSSPESTLIVDCLYTNRIFAQNWMVKMLSGNRVLKVFCGCDNDVFRMQKDWTCFANGIVDIQDMFLVWKRSQPAACYQICRSAIEKRLRENGKDSSENSMKASFQNMIKPGLEFLMTVFIKDDNIKKDKVATYADWRVRPLDRDLIRYSACDSYYTLTIFYMLYSKVGIIGVKAAANETIKKLLNRSSLPRYKNNVIATASGQWVVEKILTWRSYLALHLDYKPDQILNSKFVPELASKLHALTSLEDISGIAAALKIYQVPDNFLKAAKLLTAYLDKSGAQLVKMKSVICHACNHEGHVAKFCYMDKNIELKKGFLDRPENLDRKIRQNNRRHNNFCIKYDLDPLTTTCPWETYPYIPKKRENEPGPEEP